ncbi:hypothetical protein V5O48_019271, partial [Marasmius crinis-equi]
GVSLHYGKSPLERRQNLQAEIGRTKKNRSTPVTREKTRKNQEKIRSYRPPDTIKALMGPKSRRSTSLSIPSPKNTSSRSSKEGVYDTADSSPPPRTKRVRFSDNLTSASATPARNVPPPYKLNATYTVSAAMYHEKPKDGSGNLRLVVGKDVVRIQDAPWRENSCWVDSGYTALWWTAAKDLTALAHLIAADAKSKKPSPFTPILAALDKHRRILLSNQPPDRISAALFQLK